MSIDGPAISAAMRRPRAAAGTWLVVVALVALALLGWWSITQWPMPMPGALGVRAPIYVGLTFAMWLLMMVAMMVPSAAPVVLLFHRVQRGATWRTAAFVAGYLAAWAAYSLAATVGQVLLIEAGIVDTMGAATSRWVAAGLLTTAATWQWLPVKDRCLQQCRSPAEFLATHYRSGAVGALRTGLAHGAYCVGCCWALMLLLFVGGVMNLAWVAGITLVVAVEKLAPQRGALIRDLLATGLLVLAMAVVLGLPFGS